MTTYFKEFLTSSKSNISIVILHGLFGSSKNWFSVAKVLQTKYNVFLLDARNHGYSSFIDSHTLDDLACDLKNWLQKSKLNKSFLIGHSMGGLTVMYYLLKNISLNNVQGSIIVDIAPKNYVLDYTNELKALSLPLHNYKNKKQIDKGMEPIIPETQLRNFLQMNIDRDEEKYYWRINTPILKKTIRNQGYQVDWEAFHGKPSLLPIFFIKGLNSSFMNEQDDILIKKYFPSANLETIEAGHWLHYTHFNRFISLTSQFIESCR